MQNISVTKNNGNILYLMQSPQRITIESPRGVTLFMPGYLKENGALAVKIVSVFNNNSSKNIFGPRYYGMVCKGKLN